MESGRSAVRPSSRRGVDQDEARGLVLRFLDGDVRADPYPLLNRIREAGPVWFGSGAVVLSSYAHCEAALRAADTLTPSVAGCPFPAPRSREGVERAFSPDAVAGLAPLVRSLVDDRLDSVAARGRLEAVSDLAHPVPMAVLSRLLGLPSADGPWLHRRAMALSPGPDPRAALSGTNDPEGPAEHRRAETELEAYLADAVRDRRHRTEGPDLLSRLLRAEGRGEHLTDAETASVGLSLLGSGYATTAALVSGGVLALLRAPHELEVLARDPGHAGRLVEETLRLDPPLQVLQRRAGADLDLYGTRVPQGTVMVLMLAAAHRDPALRSSPDVFAPDGTSGHLAFGTGPHRCLGAPLARLIAGTVLARFAQRVHGARFALGSPAYHSHAALRGLRALWVDADGFGARDLPWHPGPA
ncbi:cytochrome P450 [Streptomyces sp. NPDC056194]|uniref:cytochrome P450 n=1 Tax=unclassified Streptomyces TaxID=2593676 RepID=UPI0035DBF3DC